MLNQRLIKRHYRVTGRVQGVSFRMATQVDARKLNLTGWVKNCSDGSVELIACGDQASLDQLAKWLQHGPPFAQVDQLTSIADSETLNVSPTPDFVIVR